MENWKWVSVLCFKHKGVAVSLHESKTQFFLLIVVHTVSYFTISAS